MYVYVYIYIYIYIYSIYLSLSLSLYIYIYTIYVYIHTCVYIFITIIISYVPALYKIFDEILVRGPVNPWDRGGGRHRCHVGKTLASTRKQEEKHRHE